jgi:Zn-finger domain-containing protein
MLQLGEQVFWKNEDFRRIKVTHKNEPGEPWQLVFLITYPRINEIFIFQ